MNYLVLTIYLEKKNLDFYFSPSTKEIPGV